MSVNAVNPTTGELTKIAGVGVLNGTWTTKTVTTSTQVSPYDFTVTIQPSEGKRIIAVGCAGATPLTSWDSILLIRSCTPSSDGTAKCACRTVPVASPVTQAYNIVANVLEVDE